MRPCILAHGGAGSNSSDKDGCEAAVRAALEVLQAGGDAMAAALQATVVLEDDPRFNAGTGSNYRLDGETIQMDASIMVSDGRFGGVACIERVKNPVLVAARVMTTPHLLLCGDGATAFARCHGFAEHDPASDSARQRFEAARAQLPAWVAGNWNFEGSCDTVGAVVRDEAGQFAATASTGGTTYMLRGRVGDSPLLGAGVYAGPAGAVAATGSGEAITRVLLCRSTYDLLAQGASAEEAAGFAMSLLDRVDVGVLVVGRESVASRCTRDMAFAKLEI